MRGAELGTEATLTAGTRPRQEPEPVRRSVVDYCLSSDYDITRVVVGALMTLLLCFKTPIL